MFTFPDPKTQDPKERRKQRLLEVIPGLLTWGTLLGMPIASFFVPVWAAGFIIAFDLYWILRIIFISYYSIKANIKMSVSKKTDWWERCQNIGEPEKYVELLQEKIARYKSSLVEMKFWNFWQKHLVKNKIRREEKYLRKVEKFIPMKNEIWDWRSIVQVVFFPTAIEPAEVIEPAIQSVADCNFPNSQIIVLLGTEEREDPAHRLAKVEYLKKKFSGVFRDFIVTTHIVSGGEMKCKASNATFAAKELKKYLDEKNIDYKRVVFSNFDCDSVSHPEYLAALTYAYITNPQRLQRAYQPIPVYHNNLWDTNAVVRLVVTGSSFWHLYQSTRKEMVTFSSHSEPFDTLVKVNFWPVNMISEDSVIYWKCLAYFHGDYEVRPIHLPVSLDASLAETTWQTLKNQYKQKRRWAYGIENFPVTMRAIWPDKIIPFWKKAGVTFEMLYGHYSWATTSFVITFLGWLPLLLGGQEFRESVLAHNLPLMTQRLMTMSLVGFCVSIPLSLLSLPPRPKKYHWTKNFVMIFQWFLAPIVFFLSALPAIDSQTRVLIKKYFGEFWVTPKMKK